MKRTRKSDARTIPEHSRWCCIFSTDLEYIMFTAAFLTLTRDCQRYRFSLTLFWTLEFKKAARGIMTFTLLNFFFLLIDLGTDLGDFGFLGLSSISKRLDCLIIVNLRLTICYNFYFSARDV